MDFTNEEPLCCCKDLLGNALNNKFAVLTKVVVHCFLLATYSIIESNPAVTSLIA
jgi:hypothetical protein